jgi:nitronate monooxygenase
VQNALTREIRAAAAKAGNAGLMSLWAGQGVPFIRAMPAGELISTLWAEACEASAALHARMAAP